MEITDFRLINYLKSRLYCSNFLVTKQIQLVTNSNEQEKSTKLTTHNKQKDLHNERHTTQNINML